jgi:uncharacterized repeat protein (TIGR01451 family)
MKNISWFFFFFITLTQLELRAQCTDPPLRNELNAYLFKCGDYYRGHIRTTPDLSFANASTFIYNLYAINDTAKTTLLSSSSNNDELGYIEDYIPSEHQGFLVEVIATNDCGSDTISKIHMIESIRKRTPIPTADSTCAQYHEPYLSGPSTLDLCSKNVSYVVRSRMHRTTASFKDFRYGITSNGNTTFNLWVDRDTIWLDNIPEHDFEIRVTTNDSCTCSGFNMEPRHFISKFVTVNRDSTCGTIRGTAYVDELENCFSNEYRLPRRIVSLKDNVYAYTNDFGYFNQQVYFGDYEVSAVTINNETDCNTSPFNITLNNDTKVVTQDLNVSTRTEIVRMWVNADRSRVGVLNYANILLENGYARHSNLSLTIKIPEKVDMSSLSFYTSIYPTDVSGRIVSWDIIQLEPFERIIYPFKYELLPSAELNEELTWIASLSTQSTTTDSVISIVTNSYDPNEVVVDKKEVLVESINKTLKYTVHFQNTGNDTAYFVKVVDTLDTKLDMSTLIVAGSSHDFDFNIVSGNVLKWTFENINLLDSASNEEASKGWFQYIVDFKDNVVLQDVAKSTAYIYFDTNEPIITNTAVSTIVNKTNILENTSIEFSLFPNPAQSELQLTNSGAISSFQILTIDGRVIIQGKNIRSNEYIDIQSLVSGIYYLNVRNDKGESSVKSFQKL